MGGWVSYRFLIFNVYLFKTNLMNEEIVFKGEWFLPSNIKNKVKGTLTFKPNGKYSILELFGSLSEYEDSSNVDFILGNTLEGVEITLYKSYISSASGIPRNELVKMRLQKDNIQQFSSYGVEYIFTNVHIKSIEDLVFQKVETEIYNLDEWLGIHGFSKFKKDFENGDGLKIDFNYIQPKPIEFKINENLDGAFRFTTPTSSTSKFQKEYIVTQTTYLTLESKEYLTLSEILDYVYKFQNFLVISMYSHTNPLRIELICDNFYDNVRIGDNEYFKNPKRIKLYYSHRKKIERERPKTHFEMLFTYEDIDEKFPILISKWFEKYEILNSTFNLIFYQFYLNEHIIDVLFLNLAQAAESFHYLLNINNKESKILTKVEFERRRKKIKDSLNDDELYDWVNLQLNNDFTLEMRLRELVTKYSIFSVSNFVGDTEVFIKQVKYSRNYYTHFNPKEKKKALNGAELVDLYLKLHRVLITAILIEIGFDKEVLNQLFINKSSRVFNI
jgi:hypothetical protein